MSTTARSFSIFPIQGEPNEGRKIEIEADDEKRRWAFVHIDGEKTLKSNTRKINEYAFTNIIHTELLISQKFVNNSTAGDPGTAAKKFGSFTMIIANVQANYQVMAAFNQAFTNGKKVQIVVVDEIEGGNHSSQAMGVSGSIASYMPTPSYEIVRMSLYAYCETYRIFAQEPGKTLVCKGNLPGAAYDFVGQSADASKDPLKKLLSETSDAIAKGLTGKKS